MSRPPKRSNEDKKRKKDGGGSKPVSLPPMPVTDVEPDYDSLLFLFDDSIPFNSEVAPWVKSRDAGPIKQPRLTEDGKDYICERNVCHEMENVGRNRDILSLMNIEGVEITQG